MTQAGNVILDDEYAKLGEREPRVLVTTSRSPSSRLTQFAKELRLIFPNADRINRGSQVVETEALALRVFFFSLSFCRLWW